MPRSIKDKLSKDELAGFDSGISGIHHDSGEVVVELNDSYYGPWEISFSESELERLIQLIRRNKSES